MYRYMNPIRLQALQRDNFTCQNCGYKSKLYPNGFSMVPNLEVHHKDGNKHNNTLENLITLCKDCHLKIAHKGDYKK